MTHDDNPPVPNEITEAPISDITHLGNWEKNSSYRDQDRKLLTSPKAITKIKSMWRFPTEVDFNIFLINNPEANRHTELGTIGKIDQAKEWLGKNMPKTAPEIIVGLKPDEVNILFTNNKGVERVPMTGWIMAHRLGHVLFRAGTATREYSYFMEALSVLNRYVGEILSGYGLIPARPIPGVPVDALTPNHARAFMREICTFRSAREKTLRTGVEAIHELFAEYITTGTVRFNPIPQSFKVGHTYARYKRDDEDFDSDNRSLDDLVYELIQYFETAIHYAVGRVYVM